MKYFTPRARTQALSFLRPRRLALACAGLCVFTAQAQVNMADSALLAQNLRAPALSETVVTATRTAQPLSDLVADVSIVDRDSIERSGATGLGDLLARLPGVEMSRNGGPGTTTSLFCVVPNHVLPPCTSMVCAWTRNPPAAPRGNPFRSD